MQKRKAILILAFVLVVLASGFALAQITNTIQLRANQIGYLPDDEKIAIAFSREVIDKKQFEIIDAASGHRVWGPKKLAASSWTGADSARHYEFYPFANLGHYALYPLIERDFQDTLAGYYRESLEEMLVRAGQNPYRIAVPFIWCSNNLVVTFITHGLLYQKLTGDFKYHQLILEHRDWLLGRNPWGISAFVGIPDEGGNTPQFPHSVIAAETKREITGGLNDGPVYGSIYRSLRGIRLFREDPYAEFQSDFVVYHDDLGDYSTNEPTMDGTADASFFLAWFADDGETTKRE